VGIEVNVKIVAIISVKYTIIKTKIASQNAGKNIIH
jgi:hypothetical protein